MLLIILNWILIFISQLVGAIARLPIPRFLRSSIYGSFAQRYRVNLAEAEKPLSDYPCFQTFFTRALTTNARKFVSHKTSIHSPADGTITAFAQISNDQLIHCKGIHYSLKELTHKSLVHYEGGYFATIYLAPRNYHRFHLPCAAQLKDIELIPGNLFPVAPNYLKRWTQLYVNNRRVVCTFHCQDNPQQQFLMILVGALNVGSILFRFAKNKYKALKREQVRFDLLKRSYHCGQELGCFALGSTIILCFAANTLADNYYEHLQKLNLQNQQNLDFHNQLIKKPIQVQTGQIIGEKVVPMSW